MNIFFLRGTSTISRVVRHFIRKNKDITRNRRKGKEQEEALLFRVACKAPLNCKTVKNGSDRFARNFQPVFLHFPSASTGPALRIRRVRFREERTRKVIVRTYDLLWGRCGETETAEEEERRNEATTIKAFYAAEDRPSYGLVTKSSAIK